MAIPYPVTQTKISTTQWGIPITDAVNANTTATGTNSTFVTNATGSITTYFASAPVYTITGTLVSIPGFEISLPSGPVAGFVLVMVQFNINFGGTGTMGVVAAAIAPGATNGIGISGNGYMTTATINSQYSLTVMAAAPVPTGGGTVGAQIRVTGGMPASLASGTGSRMTAYLFRGPVADSVVH